MDIFNVIKCEENFGDRLIWKHPNEDFPTKSQVIVNESQEAVFLQNGEGHILGPGKHTIDTGNIPFLKKIINSAQRGESTFHCQIYFINKVTRLNLPWGTPTQLDCLDSLFRVPLHVGASGSVGLRVDNSLKFLNRLVGVNAELSAGSLNAYFRDMIATRVKTYLGKVLREVSYLSISAYLDDISEAMHEKLREEMLDYGILLDSFFMPNVIVPEEDKEMINRTLRKKMEMGELGYNWADEQIAGIMKKYVENPGNQNNVGGMMAQMPVAYAFGQMLSQNVGRFSEPPLHFAPEVKTNVSPFPPSPSPIIKPAPFPDKDKKPDPASPVQGSKAELLSQMEEELDRYKKMLDKGTITQEDYDEIKKAWIQKIK